MPELPNNQANLIPVTEVIKRSGTDYHTLRYYTKIGLLPYMVRRLPYEGADSTVGHYPESVLETLKKIEDLKGKGLKNDQIKVILTLDEAKSKLVSSTPLTTNNQLPITSSPKHHPPVAEVVFLLLFLLGLGVGAFTFSSPAGFGKKVLNPLSPYLLSAGAKVSGSMDFLSTVFFGEGNQWSITPAGIASLHSLTTNQLTTNSLTTGHLTTDYLTVTRSETIAGLNAQFLNSLSSSQFLRSDLAGAVTSFNIADGTITGADLSPSISISTSGTISSSSGTFSSLTDSALNQAGVVTNTAAGVLGTLGGTTTTVLHGNSSGLPSFSSVSLTSDVIGVLPIGNGGTGSSTQNFVDLSTNQTIGGTKTFSNALAAPTSGNTINGIIINGGALSGITTLTTSGNASIGGTLSLPILTQGSILFAGAGGTISQNNSQFFWDNTNNRLGIGTTSPSANLHVNSTGNTNVQIDAPDGGYGSLTFAKAGAPQFYWTKAPSRTDLSLFNASNQEKLTVQQSGNVGIGTTSPAVTTDIRASTNVLGLDVTNAANNVWEQFTTGNRLNTYADFRVQASTFEVRSGFVNGSIALTPTGAGGVGIGTTGPNTILDVNGSITSRSLNTVNGAVYTDSTGKLLTTATGGAGTLCLISTNGGAPTWGSCSGSAATAWSSLTNPSANLTLNMGSFNTQFNTTGGTGTFYIDGTNGRIGIGTASPGEKLMVAGGNLNVNTTNIASGPKLVLQTLNTTPANNDLAGQIQGFAKNSLGTDTAFSQLYMTASSVTSGSEQGTFIFWNKVAGASTQVMNIVGGNVGIGTTAPGAKLHVNDSVDVQALVQTTGTNNAATFQADSGNGTTSGRWAYFISQSNETSPQRWDTGMFGTKDWQVHDNTASATRLLINTSGNVGIGTTNPTTQNGSVSQILALGGANNLDFTGIVTGTLNAGLVLETQFTGQSSGTTRGSQIGMQRDSSSTLTALSTNIQFLTTNAGTLAERMRIDPSGNVGIGTTGPLAPLDVDGTTSGNGSFTAWINNQTTTDATTNATLGIGMGVAATGTSSRYVQFGAGCSSHLSCTATIGHININNNAVNYGTTGADFGERIHVDESVNFGDIIGTINGLNLKAKPGSSIIGVVSDSTGFTGNDKDNLDKASNPQLGLLGQVKTYVSVENGIIEKGDFIAISATKPGFGMKATTPGRVVGIALESAAVDGKILVLVNPGWFDPETKVSDQGTVATSGETVAIKDGQLTLTKITADEVDSKQLTVDSGVFGTIKATMEAILTDVKAQTVDVAVKLTAKTAEIAEAVVEKLTVKELSIAADSATPTASTTGTATLIANSKQLVVNDTKVTASSKIIVTFQGDFSPATHYWIDPLVEGTSFTINLDQPTAKDVTLTWWIVN